MITVVIQALGAAVFFAGSVWLGRMIRHGEHRGAAARLSRLSHLLFWVCLLAPGLVGFFYPGLTSYDQLFGIPPLPYPSVAFSMGLLFLTGGSFLMVSSNHALVRLGRGTAAFLLTERVVTEGIYRWTRNPMSLGFYTMCVGIGLVAGSTVVVLGALLVVIPAHVLNLKYFEECELEIRYEESYLAYKKRTPFLFPHFHRRKE